MVNVWIDLCSAVQVDRACPPEDRPFSAPRVVVLRSDRVSAADQAFPVPRAQVPRPDSDVRAVQAPHITKTKPKAILRGQILSNDPLRSRQPSP